MTTHDHTPTSALTAEEPVHSSHIPPTPEATATTPTFKFDRMFPDIKDRTQDADAAPKVKALIALGTIMDAAPPAHSSGTHSEDSPIPAGYTYLGQFIAHEITFDGKSEEVFTEELKLTDVPQCCSPTLDLDSLYGKKSDKESGRLYESDNVRMKVGETSPGDTWKLTFRFDVPRASVDGEKVRQAQIGDPRNDENLPISQTHLAFIKFHNKVADALDEEKAKKHLCCASFDEVREQVIRHFQWIILNDYLPRILYKDVLPNVLSNMRANGGQTDLFKPSGAGGLYMPVEFSAAAFRFGHSMVRAFYEWNYFHNSIDLHPGPATIGQLFEQSGFSGNLGGRDNVSSEWIIDWGRFYDFSTAPVRPNFARKIDTAFDFRLGDILRFRHPTGAHSEEMLKSFRPLPVRNLLRGFALRLPSGQDIAEALGVTERVASEDIARGPHEAVLKEYGFHENTPLWYYVLKEAETLGEGNTLGPVGSRLVAETFIGIIMNSEFSILDPADESKNWRPRFGARAPYEFDMTDLLDFAFAGNVSPIDALIRDPTIDI